MHLERQIGPDDIVAIQVQVSQSLWRGWTITAPPILLAFILIAPLAMHQGQRFIFVQLGSFLYLGLNVTLLLAAERAMSEGVRQPQAPMVLWTLLSAGTLTAVALEHDHFPVALAFFAALLVLDCGLWFTNRKRRRRLLGPIALDTDASGIEITRPDSTLKFPWDAVRYSVHKGGLVLITQSPRRIIAFPSRELAGPSILRLNDQFDEIEHHARKIYAASLPAAV